MAKKEKPELEVKINPEETETIVDNLKEQSMGGGGGGEEKTEEKKTRKRKTRKSKEPEPLPFNLDDAGTLIALPFMAWGKPLDPAEQKRMGEVFGRWLDKRASMLAEYAVDITLAICLLECIMKRSKGLKQLFSTKEKQPPAGEQKTNDNA